MTEPVLAIVAEKRVVAVMTTIAEDDIPNISHEFGTKVNISDTLIVYKFKFKFDSINIREGYGKRISCICQSIFLRKTTTSPHIYVHASQSFPAKFERFIGGDNNGF